MSHSETRPAGRAMPRFPEFVAMMASLMALTALSIDVMLPALPSIRADFALHDLNDQQLVVTDYLVGFAVGQLFQGPLSDRFGRRAVLLSGIALYVVAAFACMFADSFEVLLAARLIQGVANAAPRVIAIAVVRDVYGGRRMAEVMSFVMMVFIIVPVLAPSIGSAILVFGEWHLIFGFLCLFSMAVLIWIVLRLPETHPPERRERMSVAWLVQAFGETLRTPQTIGYALATGMIFGSLMSYINSAQQVFVDTFELGQLFPVLFGLVAVAVALASYLNSRFVSRLGMRRVSHGALLCFIAVSLLHLGVYLVFGQPPVVLFLVLLSLNLFFFGLIMPNFNALTMEPMGRIAGTASSLVGALTTAMGTFLGWYIGGQYNGTVAPLLAGFAAVGVASLLLVLVTERGRLFGSSA